MLNVKILYFNKTKLVVCLLNDVVFFFSIFKLDLISATKTVKLRLMFPYFAVLVRTGLLVSSKKFF